MKGRNIIIALFVPLLYISVVADAFAVVKPMQTSTTKYIQGLHYTNGHLFYGTNEGQLYSIRKDDKTKLHQKWFQKISSRNIQRIRSNGKLLLITCDSVGGEAGSSVVCDVTSSRILERKLWKDTTVYETLTDNNEWIRVNARGHVESKQALDVAPFSLHYRIPMSSMDFLTCATIHKNRLYATTMQGKLVVVDLIRKTIVTWHSIHMDLSTCIHVASPPASSDASNSVFVYIANQQGYVYFTQITGGIVTSHTMKSVHSSFATQIDSNQQGVFVSFGDSHIVSLEMMSFREQYSVKTGNPSFTNIDSFCLSPRGLFYVDNKKNEICMETLPSVHTPTIVRTGQSWMITND